MQCALDKKISNKRGINPLENLCLYFTNYVAISQEMKEFKRVLEA